MGLKVILQSKKMELSENNSILANKFLICGIYLSDSSNILVKDSKFQENKCRLFIETQTKWRISFVFDEKDFNEDNFEDEFKEDNTYKNIPIEENIPGKGVSVKNRIIKDVFEELYKLCIKNYCKIIVVEKFSNVCDSLKRFLEISKRFEKNGILIFSAAEASVAIDNNLQHLIEGYAREYVEIRLGHMYEFILATNDEIVIEQTDTDHFDYLESLIRKNPKAKILSVRKYLSRDTCFSYTASTSLINEIDKIMKLIKGE